MPLNQQSCTTKNRKKARISFKLQKKKYNRKKKKVYKRKGNQGIQKLLNMKSIDKTRKISLPKSPTFVQHSKQREKPIKAMNLTREQVIKETLKIKTCISCRTYIQCNGSTTQECVHCDTKKSQPQVQHKDFTAEPIHKDFFTFKK